MDEDKDLNISESEEWLDIDISDLHVNRNEKYVYIDVQGFKMPRNRFMCKEFCLVDGEFVYHSFIESPFGMNKLPKFYQNQANWLMNHYHRIEFNYGDMSIIEMKQNLVSKLQSKIVLVKGFEKSDWLKYIFRDCVEFHCFNIEDLNFDLNEMENNYAVCQYHRQYFSENGPCAMTNAFIIQDLCNKHSKYLDDNVRLLYLFNKRT